MPDLDTDGEQRGSVTALEKPRLKVLLALDFYDYRLHKGVSKVAAKQGWNLLCTQNMAGAGAVPAGWSGDGIISLVASDESRNVLAQYTLPRVELGIEASPIPLTRVIPDNNRIGEIAVEYFIQRGIRSFIIDLDTANFKMLEQRKDAFTKQLLQLKEQGQSVKLHFLSGLKNSLPESKTTSADKKAEILTALKEIKKPAAYLGYDDEMAMRFMADVREIGYQVPEDFLVLGVDNNDLFCEGLDISLSSIETDLIGVGEKAALKLVEQFTEQLDVNNTCKNDASQTHTQNSVLEKDKIYLHQPRKVITRDSTEQYVSNHPIVSRVLIEVTEKLNGNRYSKKLEQIPNANQLADQFGLTQQGLQKLFREHYHCSPATAIRELRLRHAKNLLFDSTISLKEVAYQTGFSSTESLSRCFKQHFGVAPGKWRRDCNQ